MTLRLINLSGDAWACARPVWWTVECADWEKEIDQWMIITSQKRIWIRHLWINLISLATSSGCFLFQVQHLESTKIWRWFDLSWPPFDPFWPNVTFCKWSFLTKLAGFDQITILDQIGNFRLDSPFMTKLAIFDQIGNFWPNLTFSTENNEFFSISTVQPLSIFKMVSTTSKQPSSTPDIHTNIKAVTSKAPSTSTLSKWLKTTFSDPMDWPIRTWKPTKMIQLDRRKNAWLYFIANSHQNELQQCCDSSEKWTEQKTDIQRLTSRNYISSKTATR